MKTYICNREGLLMVSPAVILHKGQKLAVESETVEIFNALKAGKLEELDTATKPSTEDTGKKDQGDAKTDKSTSGVEEPAAKKKGKGSGKKPRTTAKVSDEDKMELFL